MDILCELTVVIPRLLYLFRLANTVSSTVELLNPVTSHSVDSFNIVMWAFAGRCFPNEQVPCCDGWQRTWWQMIHMIPWLPVSSILQCKKNRHEDVCLEFFLAIGHFAPTSIDGHQALKMICKVRSLKSRIKTHSLLEEIITFSIKLCKDIESDMAVELRNLSNPTWVAAERKVIVQRNVGSSILTLEQQAKKSDLWDIVCIFVRLNTRTYWKDWPSETQFGNSAMHFIAVQLTDPRQKLLMLGGCSILGGGCDIITSIFANTGCW